MTVVNLLWGPASWKYGSYFGSADNLSNGNNSVATLFTLPKSGAIEAVGFLVANGVGTPPNYNVGLVTVNASGPTTTPYGGSEAETYIHTGTGWQWVALSPNATGTAGDLVAVRVWPGGVTPSISNYISVVRDDALGIGFPQTTRYSSFWIQTSGLSMMALRYADGTVWGLAANTVTDQAFNSGTASDEYGCKFTVPVDLTCSGAVVFVGDSIGPTTNAQICLYDESNTLLRSYTIQSGNIFSYADTAVVYWQAVNLTANIPYRLTVRSLSDTNISIPIWDFTSVAAREFMPEGTRWQLTQRADGGTWTDTPTKLAHMALMVADIQAEVISTGTASASVPYGWVG